MWHASKRCSRLRRRGLTAHEVADPHAADLPARCRSLRRGTGLGRPDDRRRGDQAVALGVDLGEAETAQEKAQADVDGIGKADDAVDAGRTANGSAGI